MASNATPKPQTQQASAEPAKAPDAASGKTVLQPRCLGPALPLKKRRRDEELRARALLVKAKRKKKGQKESDFISVPK